MILSISSPLAQVTALARIYKNLLRERRFTFLALLILVFVGAVVDSIGVALVMPLLAAFQNGVVTTPLGLEAMTRWTENSVAGIAALVGAVFVLKNLLALTRIRGTLVFTYGLWRQWVERIVRNVVHGPVLTTEVQKPGAPSFDCSHPEFAIDHWNPAALRVRGFGSYAHLRLLYTLVGFLAHHPGVNGALRCLRPVRLAPPNSIGSRGWRAPSSWEQGL